VAAHDAAFWGFGPPGKKLKSPNSRTTQTKGTNMTDTVNTTDTPEPADDLDDLTPDDYATAAAEMAQEAAEAQDASAEVVDADEPDDEAEPTGRGPRYRERLRDAEAERDRLTTLVEGMRRSEIERVASTMLADPADLFRDGAQVSDVLDADGRIDQGKIAATIDRVLSAHPHWRAEPPKYKGTLHSGATNTRLIDAPSKGFVDAFAPKAE
jgi:hypothetical protein